MAKWSQAAMDCWLAGIPVHTTTEMLCTDVMPDELPRLVGGLHYRLDELLDLRMRAWLMDNPRPIGR